MLLGAAAQAQITPSEAVARIIANNPSLKALATSNQAEHVADLDAAGSFAGPEVEFEHMWNATGGDNKWNAGVTQSFEWPGVYGKRRTAAEARSLAMQYLYDAKALEIRTQAKDALAGAVYASSRKAMLDSVRANLERLVAYISDGYKSGQQTILDVKKSRLELFTVGSQIANVENEIAQYTATITELNGGEPLDIDLSAYLPEPMLPLSEYERQAAESNPDVKALSQSALWAQQEAEAAHASRYPGFSIGYRHAYEEATHFNGLAVGISLPIFSNRKALKVAELRKQSYTYEALAANAAARANLAAAYSEAQRRRAYLDGLGANTLDESYPSLLLMAYKGGQINVLTYLQELNYYISARQDYLAAEYALRTALIALNRYNP